MLNRYRNKLFATAFFAVFCVGVNATEPRDAEIKNVATLIKELNVVRSVAIQKKDSTVITESGYPFNYALFISDIESMITRLEEHNKLLMNTPRLNRFAVGQP